MRLSQLPARPGRMRHGNRTRARVKLSSSVRTAARSELLRQANRDRRRRATRSGARHWRRRMQMGIQWTTASRSPTHPKTQARRRPSTLQETKVRAGERWDKRKSERHRQSKSRRAATTQNLDSQQRRGRVLHRISNSSASRKAGPSPSERPRQGRKDQPRAPSLSPRRGPPPPDRGPTRKARGKGLSRSQNRLHLPKAKASADRRWKKGRTMTTFRRGSRTKRSRLAERLPLRDSLACGRLLSVLLQA